MQHRQSPILGVVKGDGGTISGEHALEKVRDLLTELLPRIPMDDPFRTSLAAFASAAGCPQRAQSPLRATQ